MKLHDLPDWRECLENIRALVDYSNLQSRFSFPEEGFEEDSDEVLGIVAQVSNDIDDLIGEGMLQAVVSRPPEEASRELVQFADELRGLRPRADVESQGGGAASSYKKLFEVVTETQAGLPALVETFQRYSQGRYDTCKRSLDLLKQAKDIFAQDEEAALGLVGEAGCLYLRGLETESFDEGETLHPMSETLDYWLRALAGVMEGISQRVDEYPLGEVELAHDKWQKPDDVERIEYKRGKLARLGVTDPDLQALLLPLFDARTEAFTESEEKAILEAGPRVVPALVGIADDCDSSLASSVSGGRGGHQSSAVARRPARGRGRARPAQDTSDH